MFIAGIILFVYGSVIIVSVGLLVYMVFKRVKEKKKEAEEHKKYEYY